MAQAFPLGVATQALCAAGGSLELEELRRLVRTDAATLDALLRRDERLAVAVRGCGDRARRVVLAVTALRLCRGPPAGQQVCPGACAQLHLCKFQMYGACRFQKSQRTCRNGHSLSTLHNQRVLNMHGLNHLSYSELSQLLFQNDPWLLPEICLHYNKGDGPFGACTYERQCIKLHICQYFLQHECKFGASCKRSHDFYRLETLEKLKKLGMSTDLIRRLPSIYRNAHDIKNRGSVDSLARCATTTGVDTAYCSTEGVDTARCATEGVDTARCATEGVDTARCATEGVDTAYCSTEGVDTAHCATEGVDIARCATEGVDTAHCATEGVDIARCATEGVDTARCATEGVDTARCATEGVDSAQEGRDKATSVSSSTASQEESHQICLYHIRKSCSFKDKCHRVHFHLPYRWQYQDGDTWKDMDKMELIEEAYSNPQKEWVLPASSASASSCDRLNFGTMMIGTTPARRLSTASSVMKPPHFILTTEWVWYWTDETGAWQEYGKQGTQHPVATVSSPDLEKAYLAYCTPGSDAQAATLKFSAGKHNYEVDFKAFVQKNLGYGTARKVSRRPKYVSPQDVKKQQACNVGFKGPRNIPSYWDPSALPDLGFKRVTLSPSSEEYQKTHELFSRTLPSYVIQKIERVQNVGLWEVYQWQKGQMQKQRGDGEVNEQQLFHGTKASFVDAICQQNFDWRVCGLHGTSYGKGSYFARDAAYSHHYSEASTQSYMMFLARVLVGDFTRGCANYVRPPVKEGQATVFYDSCVNSMTDPSIFVVFEKHQVYPEYLIHYVTNAQQQASRVAPLQAQAQAQAQPRPQASAQAQPRPQAPLQAQLRLPARSWLEGWFRS
ncbi:protein mono-ADP-ribosyltransferase PARP12 [Rhynchocyon petersi]